MTPIVSVLSPIGPVPDDWSMKPLQAVVRPLGRKNVGLVETNLLSLSYGSIIRKDIDALEGLLPESFEGYQIVEEGDVVFRFTDLQNDQRSLRSGLAQERGIITSAYLAVRPTSINARYFTYLMRAYDQEKVFYSFGGGVRQSLKFDDVKRLPIPIPTVERQRRIAEFLDRETAQIDELIAKQEQLISTLAERQRELLRHLFVVASSGAPSAALGILSRVGNGSTPSRERPEYWLEGAFPWLNSSVANNDYVRAPSDYVSDLALRECHLPVVAPGSTLVGLTGQGRTRGMATRLSIKATISQHLAYVTPGRRVESEFLYWALVNEYETFRETSDGNGGTKGGLTCEAIRRTKIPVPSLEQQAQVASTLQASADIAKLARERVEQAILLLRERRQALIRAAVTGQIDVGGAS